MAKSSVIFLVVLFCLWGGDSAATSVPVLYLQFPGQIYFMNKLLAVPDFPSEPGVRGLAAAAGISVPNRTSGEPEDPDDPDPPDPQPSPVRPDMQGELSGKDHDPPPPPP